MMFGSLPTDYRDGNVCLLGLGFVGLTLAACMADVGFRITGIEIKDDVREKLKASKGHFFEPGLNESLHRALSSGRLTVHPRIPTDCDATVFIITVGTPLGADGRVSLTGVSHIAHEIAERIKDGDLVILRSTVKIGTTQDVVKPILDRSGRSFELAFCPERTVEGQALAELRYLPQIIGAEALHTVTRAAQLFGFVTPTVVRVSSAETAEMIKLIDNSNRDVRFAFANEIARMCDRLGISAAEVIRSGRFGYSRTDVAIPGPVGGPCLSKDSHILAESVHQRGILPEITTAARAINERQPEEIVSFLKSHTSGLHGFPSNPKIALCGIAFKGRPPTDDVRGSMAFPLWKALKSAFPDGRFVAHDPVIESETLIKLAMTPVETLEEAFRNSNLIVVANNHPIYAGMPLEALAATMAMPALIYDCWNNFIESPMRLTGAVQYITLGSHHRATVA
jgi:UDP-N-acetyl-D-mannosaminuronic acid dehydrogenase